MKRPFDWQDRIVMTAATLTGVAWIFWIIGGLLT